MDLQVSDMWQVGGFILIGQKTWLPHTITFKIGRYIKKKSSLKQLSQFYWPNIQEWCLVWKILFSFWSNKKHDHHRQFLILIGQYTSRSSHLKILCHLNQTLQEWCLECHHKNLFSFDRIKYMATTGNFCYKLIISSEITLQEWCLEGSYKNSSFFCDQTKYIVATYNNLTVLDWPVQTKKSSVLGHICDHISLVTTGSGSMLCQMIHYLEKSSK